MELKSKVPWWAKIFLKIILARIPVDYAFWRKINLFKHGDMDNLDRAISTFHKYFRLFPLQYRLNHCVALELGPGDSLLGGIVAIAQGFGKVYLVDAGDYAVKDLDLYKKAVNFFIKKGSKLPNVSEARSFDELLEKLNIQYLVNGVDSLKKIEDGSVDFHWSNVVLEHIRKNEFPVFLKELRRISKKGSVGYHGVDLRDHLGGALNNLRIADSLWEKEWFSNSGFYTNRIRYTEMLEYFRLHNFIAKVDSVVSWPKLPTPRKKILKRFQDFPEDDLLISEFNVALFVELND